MAAYFEEGSPAMQQLAAIVDRLEQMVTLIPNMTSKSLMATSLGSP